MKGKIETKKQNERRFYSLLEDFVFKQVFGDRKNTGKLALLLESVLFLSREELATLKIENTFIERTWKGEKLVILDVLAGTENGWLFDVELQIEKLMFFGSRMVYYLCKLITEQLRRGRDYDKIRPVYCVAICDFVMLPEAPGYIHHIALREEKTGALFTNLENIVIIELPKMPKQNDGSRAWPVLQCFRCKTGEEADMLAKAYPAVKDILDDLRNFSLAKEIRSAYNLYMKAWRDREAYKNEYLAREREKWEAERGAERSEIEALKRELAQLRAGQQNETRNGF